jgi:hypothetical protein
MKTRLYAIAILLLSVSLSSFSQDVHVCDRLLATTANSLQDYVRGSTVTAVDMLGYANPGDGGGGRFVWVPGSTTFPSGAPTPSTGSLFVAAAAGSGTGYWRRETDGNSINALWFGLKAEQNNTSNTTVQTANNAAFTNALAAADYLQIKLYIPGTLKLYAYHFASTIVIDKAVDVFGDASEKNTEFRTPEGTTGMQIKNGGIVFVVALKNIRMQYGYIAW